MSIILNAAPLINDKIESLTQICSELATQGLRPKLEVIIVGDDPASAIYVKNKRILCKKVGAEFSLIELPNDTTKDVFLEKVNSMNNDPSVTGCFVQLPVPKHLQDINITELINPKKDIDGFHSQNIISLYNNKPALVSCTPKGILELLDHYQIEIESKNVVIIGRGFIVGRPLALLLQNRNATVTLCHSKSKNIPEHTKNADIIVCALGKENFLNKSFINSNKNQTIIDVGINKDSNGKLCGDVNFEEIKDLVHAITPVPGGVGPMTVYSLINNLITATRDNLKEKKDAKN